ncbi:unnamed protein product [Caenorhabditis auriculariae]|uniref:Palmitoyltransferase n=1 Tax=Caenorhabditis auriculariae TaxID=2777116 RepID=A0A8S1GPW3_9PELO|nr:unnamed protein product [Caenorhabditis auriculariae]
MALARVNRKLAKLGDFLLDWGGSCFVSMMLIGIYYSCLYVAAPMLYDEEATIQFLRFLANFIVFEIMINLACFHYYSRYNSVTHWHRESCVLDLRSFAEENNENGRQYFALDNLENHLNGVTEDESGSRFCITCNREAPIRSHHCPLCKMCVLRKDHHCFVTGACVGLGNQRYFIVFLFWCTFGLIIAVPHLFWLLTQTIGPWYPFGFTLYIGPIAIFRWIFSYSPFSEAVYATIFSFSVAGFFSAAGFLGMQIYYTTHGYTMYEYHNLTVRASFPGDGKNCGERFRLVFGKNWLLNFVLPMPWNMPLLTQDISNSLFRFSVMIPNRQPLPTDIRRNFQPRPAQQRVQIQGQIAPAQYRNVQPQIDPRNVNAVYQSFAGPSTSLDRRLIIRPVQPPPRPEGEAANLKKLVHPLYLSSTSDGPSSGSKTYLPSEVNEAFNDVILQFMTAQCLMAGFDDVERSALETLITMFHNSIKRVAEQSRYACEAGGRTKIAARDVCFGLTNMGFDLKALPQFFHDELRRGKLTIHAPLTTRSTSSTARFFEWMPPYPEPHTYIRTEIMNEPEMSYEKAREAMAANKRNGVRSLVNHMVQIFPKVCLFGSFEQTIHENVEKWMDELIKKNQKAAAYQAFSSFLGTTEFENTQATIDILKEKGLITAEEAQQGLQLACLLPDGTILDTQANPITLTDDAFIDIPEDDAAEGQEDIAEEEFPMDYQCPVDDEMDVDISLLSFQEFDLMEDDEGREPEDYLLYEKEKRNFEYIPEWCHVVVPTDDHPSYLDRLLTDIKPDDDLWKEKKVASRSGGDKEIQLDNPYFRPPEIINTPVEEKDS